MGNPPQTIHVDGIWSIARGNFGAWPLISRVRVVCRAVADTCRLLSWDAIEWIRDFAKGRAGMRAPVRDGVATSAPATFHVRRPFTDRELEQFRGVISDYASTPAAPLPSRCASAAEGRNQHRLFMSRLSQAARGVKPIHPRHAEVKERSVSMKSETAAPAALCLVHGGVRSMPRSGHSDYRTDFVACVLCKVMFHLPESRRPVDPTLKRDAPIAAKAYKKPGRRR
jgi:hypothetical protein